VQNDALPVIFYDYGGLELAARIGRAAKPELVRLSGSASVAMSNVPLPDLARAYIAWVDAHVDSLDDASAQCWGIMTTGVTLSGWGLWDEAMPRFERTIAIAEAIGDTQRWFEAGSFITSSLHHTGRYADAERFNARFYALFKSQNFLPAAIWCGAGRVLNAVNRGQHHLALDYAAEALAALELLKDRLNNMRIFGQMARIYLRLGDTARALEYAQRVAPLLAESTPSAWQAIDGCAGLAEVSVALYDRAPTPEAESRARAACGYLEGFAKVFDVGRPQTKIYQGWLGVLTGEVEFGLGAIRDGIAEAQALKMPHEEAQGHYLLGRLLPAGDPEGREALEAAAAIFARIGADWDAAQVRAALG
jgi:tetratricopeptide (TPR) repeat protein